jgi:hypothetical protein
VPLGHIQRGQRAWAGYQVLHLSSAPDRIQPHLTLVAVHGAQAPQRVVQAVAVENGQQADGLVVGLRLAEVA